MDKQQLRRQMIRKMHSVSSQQRQQDSQKICQQLSIAVHQRFPQGANILFFASKSNEVDILPLFEQLNREHQYSCFFPKIIDMKNSIFQAFPVTRAEQLQRVPEHFQLREPITSESIDPTMIDLVLVPAVAIDTQGNRIGYGKGFYDRFLSTVRPNCQKWAIVFAEQCVDEILTDHYDVPVDAVVDQFGLQTLSIA